jgi:hypothetical protein
VKIQRFTLELLTPCFCAGANQAVAEIRAPAIRGQLRWWFRALGGTPAEERTVFGGVAGNASAGSLIVRVHGVAHGPTWIPPRVDPNLPDSYVWYFASVSAQRTRWTQQGALPPGTKFTLEIFQHRALQPHLQSQFNLARDCFLQLGAIGLRATRGLGTFACHETPFHPDTLAILRSKGFFCEHRLAPLADTAAIAREIGALVKGTRKAQGMPATQPSPFGTSSPRQTSAIYFRPVRGSANPKDCHLVVFEAPHDRVLGPDSNGPSVIGHAPSLLSKPAVPGRRG